MKKLFLVLSTVCMVLSMTVTTFAYQVGSIDVPSPTEIYEAQKGSYPYGVLTQSGDEVWLWLSKEPFVPDGSGWYYGGGGYKNFKYDSESGVWVKSATGTNAAAVNNVILTTHDIYSNSGALVHTAYLDFFSAPPPLAEVIQGVTEEAMTETLPALGGTMTTLVVCGVGCLALLVVLKLFGKRSLIFRS